MKYTKKIKEWIIKHPAYVALGTLIGPWLFYVVYIGFIQIIGTLSIVAFFACLVLIWDNSKKKMQLAQEMPPSVVFTKVEQLEMEADLVEQQRKSKYIQGKETDNLGSEIETIDREAAKQHIAKVEVDEKARKARIKQREESYKNQKIELEIQK